MAHILVIGGASSDILHLAGQTLDLAGGAGMYTAMAARRSGAQVSMFGPRPEPCPDRLQPVADLLTAWLGPACPPQELPQFEISYEGGITQYLKEKIGAEMLITPQQLPGDISKYDLVHVTPLGDAHRQLAFMRACRERGASRISAGTGLFNVRDQAEDVRRVMDESDCFFMNQEEAQGVCGSIEAACTSPGKVLFLTMGEAGARVIQGNYITQVSAVPAKLFDPTGAGDTFCGATIARLAQGQHPVMAARSAVALAAEMIAHAGPEALLWKQPHPAIPVDSRVLVNEGQVLQVAQLVAALPEVTPFDFTGLVLPPAGDPLALDWFFATTLQQFSFWTMKDGSYHQPLIAAIDGMQLKGSDYLWQGYMRALREDPGFFSAERQANQTREELLALFQADDGSQPMPALELHLEQGRAYGQDMLALGFTPSEVIKQAGASQTPLKRFFELMDQVGGYKEDPLRKKTGLLAMILSQRPEKFFSPGEGEEITPVIDYHAMRTCLRTGLVEVVDSQLREKLSARRVLHSDEEWAVRHAAYLATAQVAAESGVSMGAVDWFFFNSRRRCPEMTEPLCELCQIDPVCAHYKVLFQPVMRTTFY